MFHVDVFFFFASNYIIIIGNIEKCKRENDFGGTANMSKCRKSFVVRTERKLVRQDNNSIYETETIFIKFAPMTHLPPLV